jgi:hypothetical protein
VREWCGELFGLLDDATPPDRAVAVLFDTAARALAEAESLAEQDMTELGLSRPVVHLVGFYLGAAARGPLLRGELTDLPAAARDRFASQAVAGQLRSLFDSWGSDAGRGDRLAVRNPSPDEVREKVLSLPKIKGWLVNCGELEELCKPLLPFDTHPVANPAPQSTPEHAQAP